VSAAPPPLEWHPYYRDQTWLLDWLDRRGRYADHEDLRLPVRLPRPSLIERVDDIGPQLRTITMVRRRAVGAAPYVGRPFHYEWYVGVDDLGRCIAGESRIVYELQPAPWQRPTK
jgi:hypothetical protein